MRRGVADMADAIVACGVGGGRKLPTLLKNAPEEVLLGGLCVTILPIL